MAAVEEAEASERPRRPRGRPRLEPLSNHGRSSSRDSMHDDDLQHTVDGDGGPRTEDEEAVPVTEDEEVATVRVPLPLVRRSPTSEVPQSSRSDRYLLRGAH